MAEVTATIPVGIQGNLPQVATVMRSIANTMAQTPLKVNLTSTGAFNDTDAKNFFDQIKAGATNVEKLTVTVKEFKNIVGDAYRIPTQAIVTMKDETGFLHKEIIKLNEDMIQGLKATEGIKATGQMEEVTANIGKDARQLEIHFAAMKKGIDSTAQSASTFMEKSKNMSGPQVEGAKKAAQAILEEKKAFDAAFSSQQWDKVRASGDKIRDLKGDFDTLKGATQAGANVFQSWGERMSNAIKQTISYGLSIQLVYKAQRLLNDAVKYAIDLNTEMTKVQVLQAEGAKTPEEINSLAVSFNKLGQEMGASTLEIAKGSVEWFRQGRTVQETQELMRASMMLSKLGAMESSDATNYLTSITNAFKVEVNDTVTVVDKLIAVDNIAATSAGELATAMRYTSESAALAGVGMEQLISYIGTVSTVTRQNAEMIGQSFKTMFARMTLIQGGGVDEEGWTISKVEKALNAANISVKNAQGTFRNMGDVLEETAAKWDTLGERERIEIAIAIAGVRQKESFLVLMNNMDKALKYQAAQTDVSGLAMNRYGIYMESVAAKQGKLKAQMEELYTKTINSNTIMRVLDLASAMLKLLDSIGGLAPVLVTAIGLLLLFNGAMVANKIAGFYALIDGMITSLGTFVTALRAGTLAQMQFSAAIPVVGVILALVGGAIALHNKAVNDHKKAVEDATIAVQAYIDNINKLPKTLKDAEGILTEVNAIINKPANERTTEDAENLLGLYSQLEEILPNLNWKYANGKPYLDAATLSAIDLNAELQKENSLIKEGGDSLVIWQQEQQRLSDQYQSDLERDTKKQETLIAVRDAINSGQLQTYGDMIDYLDTLYVAEKKWTEGKKQGYGEAKTLLDPLLKIGVGLDEVLGRDLKANLLSAIASTGQAIQTDASSHDNVVRDLAQFYSSAMQDPAMVQTIADAEMQAWTNPTIREALYKAWNDNAEWLKSQLSGGISVPMPKVETDEEKLARQNKEYTDALALVNKLAPSIKRLNTALNQEGDNIADVETAVTEMNVALQEINDAGLDIPIKSFDDLDNAAHTALDPTLVENYRNELIAWLYDNENLKVSNETMYNMVKTQIEALSVPIGDIITDVNVLGNTVGMNAQQLDNWNNWLAQSIFNFGENATKGIQLVADDGSIITAYSIQDINMLAEAGILSENNFAMQAAKLLATYSATAAGIIRQNLGNLLKGFPLMPAMTFPAAGGGGGGSPPPNPRIKEIEDEIKALQDQIKALQEQIKAYKEYIDAQKESLKRAKAEADYLDELAKKHHDLGKLKARLAILALDDSEEAQKERLELEQEVANKEIEIAEFVEDRKYELLIQALDDMAKAFEDSINAQIAILEKLIEALEDEKETLKDVGSTGAGSFGAVTAAVDTLKESLKELIDETIDKFGKKGGLLDTMGITRDMIETMTGKWAAQGFTIDQIKQKLQAYLDLLKANEWAETWKPPIGGYNPNPNPEDTVPPQPGGQSHFGGLIEEHHGGNFAGNLQTNEVFSKLLKGEYVSTEGQMDNFFKNILPKVTGGAIMPKGANRLLANQTGVGNMNVEILVNVAGSLDKKVIPNLKKEMLNTLNKAMEGRGFKRTATNFTV